MNRELKIFAAFLGVFLGAYFIPLGRPEVWGAIIEAFKLLQWYARNHTLACVVPALFIAGAITTFLTPQSVIRHLGPKAPKLKAYGVASVSGTVLAVCSCSVLPIFAGIYRLGAGLGPASAFLYSGPAINVMAILLTAKVLGPEIPGIGVARVVGAVAFALLIGLGMAVLFRRQEQTTAPAAEIPEEDSPRPLWKLALFLVAMIGFLVFSDWVNEGDARVHLRDGTTARVLVMQETADDWTVQLKETGALGEKETRVVLPKAQVDRIESVGGWVVAVHRIRWLLAGLMGLAVLLMAFTWFERDELKEWMSNTWDFTKLVVPLLFGGVFAVGFIAALLPDDQVAGLVGGNDVGSVLIGSVVGALFYFATLTEVPIVQALTRHGMAEGPALALLLAGPALSLPNILVIGKIMGAKKTAAFCALVVIMATVAGLLFGALG